MAHSSSTTPPRSSGAQAGSWPVIGAEAEKAGDHRGTIRRFASYLTGHGSRSAAIAALVIVDVVLSSYAPRMLAIAVDQIAEFQAGSGTLAASRNVVAMAMLIGLALYLLGGGANAVARWQMVGIGQAILAWIRLDVFAKVQRLALHYFDKTQAGDLISRMTNDTAVIDRVLRMGAIRMLHSFLILLGTLIAMLAMSWRMALVSFTILPVRGWFTALFSWWSRQAFRRTRQTIGQAGSQLERSIDGEREIQPFGRERATAGTFRRANAANRDANVSAESITTAFAPTLDGLTVVGIAVVLLWGGVLAHRGLITIEILVAFVQYVRRFLQPVQSISVLWADVQSSIAGMERIYELLDDDRVAGELDQPSPFTAGRGR